MEEEGRLEELKAHMYENDLEGWEAPVNFDLFDGGE